MYIVPAVCVWTVEEELEDLYESSAVSRRVGYPNA